MRSSWTCAAGISVVVALALALGAGCGSAGEDFLPESVADGGDEDRAASTGYVRHP